MEITTWRKQHGFALLFTMLLGVAMTLMYGTPIGSDTTIFYCLITFTQIEAFIVFGRILFRFVPGQTPREITWSIVLRFMLFYVLCFLSAIVIYMFFRVLFYMKDGIPLNTLIPNFIEYEMHTWFVATSIGLTIGAFSFFIMQWQHALKKAQQLHEQNMIFQYETLNNQVNPHFLFNSLNTLASFIRTDADVAETYVIKLAQLYRYITDHSSTPLIDIQTELHFVKDYFFLHKLRDGEKIELLVSISDNEQGDVLPISLQILIENAIKHNQAIRSKPLVITVNIQDHFVVVRNNIQRMASVSPASKKGLDNLRQRYQLCMNREIVVEEDASHFTVKIPIKR